MMLATNRLDLQRFAAQMERFVRAGNMDGLPRRSGRFRSSTLQGLRDSNNSILKLSKNSGHQRTFPQQFHS